MNPLNHSGRAKRRYSFSLAQLASAIVLAALLLPGNALGNDADDCTTDVLGCGDICRTPAFWGAHGGYENRATINVTQRVLDAVGGLEVCGELITETSNTTSPWIGNLALTSALEGLCVDVEEAPVRELYRQLTAAALNCAMSSGSDCDEVLGRYIDVSFTGCDSLCENGSSAGGPTVEQCIEQLDCFNNGGQFLNGSCALGNCSATGALCADDDACPNVGGTIQSCVRFDSSCHWAAVCNESLGICPEITSASSYSACKEAAANDCSIDSCD